jgi:hypothetical protein
LHPEVKELVVRNLTMGRLAVSARYEEKVLGVTPEYAAVLKQVAEAEHVEPRRVVMRYMLAIVAVILVATMGIVGLAAWLVPAGSLHWVLMAALAVCAAMMYPLRGLLKDALAKLLSSKE